MDLDILLFGDTVCAEPGLTLPRPDLLKRPYMLGPAAEIAPEPVHPIERRTLGELWRDMQATQVARDAAGGAGVDAARGDQRDVLTGRTRAAKGVSDAATAVDGEDLPRDVGRFGREELGGARDVVRRAGALQARSSR